VLSDMGLLNPLGHKCLEIMLSPEFPKHVTPFMHQGFEGLVRVTGHNDSLFVFLMNLGAEKLVIGVDTETQEIVLYVVKTACFWSIS